MAAAPAPRARTAPARVIFRASALNSERAKRSSWRMRSPMSLMIPRKRPAMLASSGGAWTSFAMTSAPRRKRPADQEPDTQPQQQRRDRVPLDQVGHVVHHAAEVLVLDVLARAVQGAGDPAGGAAEHAAVRGVLADLIG